MSRHCTSRSALEVTPGPTPGSIVSPTGIVLTPGINVNLICLVRKRGRWFVAVRTGGPGFNLVCPRTAFIRVSRSVATTLSLSGVRRCCFAVKSLDTTACTDLFSISGRESCNP